MYFENLIKQTIEYQGHGSTQTIITLIIVLIVTAFQAWALIRQNRRIRRNESGASLKLPFFSFQLFYYSGYFLYGFLIHSGALVINNVVGLLFIPVIISLIKYRIKENGSFRKEIIISPFLIITIPIILFVNKNWSLLAMLIVATFAIMPQVREIEKTKNVNNIEPWLIISFLANSVASLGYGIWINSLGLIISSSGTILVIAIFMALYYLVLNKKNPKE